MILSAELRSVIMELKRRSSAHELFGIFFASLGVIALGFAVPFLTMRVFDQIVPQRDRSALLGTLFVMSIVALGTQGLQFTISVLRLRLQSRLADALKSQIVDRVLRFPSSFFRRYSVGEILTRAGLADGEQERLLSSALSGLFSAWISVSSLLALFRLDRRAGFVSMGAAAITLIFSCLCARKKLGFERALLKSTMELRSFLLQLFMGISKVRAAQAQPWAYAKWSDGFEIKQALSFSSSKTSASFGTFSSVVPLVCLCGFFLEISSGRYLALLAAFGFFIEGVLRVSCAVLDLACVIPLFERAQPIFSQNLETRMEGARPKKLMGQVEFQEVSFRYQEKGPWALDGVSFRIEPGQFVALVGPSGSGKSTVIRLLLGFEKPTRGEVDYDRQPLSGIDFRELRKQMGTVLQQDHLMSGNIYENISAVRPITMKEAWEAARMAAVDDVIAGFPMGMHSVITPGGRAYSGGERQRIILARAVAGKPRMLILDEATSALDNQVQEKVMRNLRNLRATRIVVAHRLSTIREADRILVFDHGRVVEQGDFSSLLARDGLFARLARRQVEVH